MDKNSENVISNEESLYKYDADYHEKLLKEKPWMKEYLYN